MDEKQIKLVEKLVKKFKDKVAVVEEEPGILYVTGENFFDVMKEIKEKYQFNMLLDLTAVDYEDKVVGVYQLMSLPEGDRLQVKVDLNKETPQVASVASIWKAADVQERETFDLMGVVYEGHPDLRRILCPDDFEGHPLRKDYKVEAGR